MLGRWDAKNNHRITGLKDPIWGRSLLMVQEFLVCRHGSLLKE